MTVTGQYSPYKFKLSSDITISANDYNDECNAGTTLDSIFIFNKYNKTKDKILMLELREKFHS